MRKQRIWLLLFPFILPSAMSGQPVSDKLELALEKPMPDTARLRVYFDLVIKNVRPDIEKAQRYADSAAVICRRLNHEALNQELKLHYGILYRFSGDYEKALMQLIDYQAYCEKTGDERKLAKALMQMGHVHSRKGDNEAGLANFQKSLAISRELKNQQGIADNLSGMAEVYNQTKQYDKALESWNEALPFYQSIKDTLSIGNTYNNLGNAYRYLKDYDKAKQYYQLDYDLAKQTNDEYAMGYALHHLGRIHRLKKEFEIAEQMLLQSLDIRRKLGHKAEICYSLNGLTQVYNEMGQPNLALITSTESLELAREMGMKSRIADALTGLAEANYNLGRYKESIDLMVEYAEIKESLHGEEIAKQIAEMDAKYQASEKDKALKISELENKSRRRQIGWLVALSIALAALAGAIFIGLKNRMRAKQRIAEQQDALRQQEIRQLEQANQLTAMRSMLEGQERERSRIAHDLHDSLGGLLASIKSHFNAAKPADPNNGIFEKANAMLDNAATEVRRISHNMMPRALALSGLCGALEDLAQDLERQGLSCQLELIGLDGLALEPDRSVMVYRIVQELTHNAVKHAGAKHLLLQAIQQNGRLTLLIEDDGKGFDVRAARQRKGLGLSSVESRVQFLRGDIEWDSVLGQGTTVSVTLPL
jgi:signal transduction histidine kinase